MPPCVWLTDSLTPAVCEAINGLYLWAKGNTVIPVPSPSQKKRRHRCQANMNESHRGCREKDSPGWGDSWNVVGTVLTGSLPMGGFTTWQLTAVSLAYHLPATNTKMGIFRIMSIIYASCLPSGYNQKPTRASSNTECDLSAVSTRTVFQTRQTVTVISSIWKTSV